MVDRVDEREPELSSSFDDDDDDDWYTSAIMFYLNYPL